MKEEILTKNIKDRSAIIDEMIEVYEHTTDKNALLCESKVRILKMIYETLEKKESYDLTHSKDLPISRIDIDFVSSDKSKEEIEALEQELMSELSIDKNKVA